MSIVWQGLVGGVTRADRALLRVRNSMTPGQRWTAALAMVVVIAVLGFGMPSGTVFLPGYAAAAPAATGQPSGAAPATPPTSTGPILSPLVGPNAPTVAPNSPSTPIAPATSAGVPGVVALTLPTSTLKAGRDDEAMAAAALTTAVFPWTDVSDTGNPTTLCQQVGRAGSVVLTAHPLALALEQCLLTNGLVVISPSPRGTRRVASGLSLSIRRGDVASLGDLATWARQAHAATGRVGLVLDGARRSDLTSAPTVVRQHGLNVVSTAWLSGSSSVSDVLGSVNQFTKAHVGTVVFAIPVAVQQRWATEASARLVHFGYLVSDVDDGVVDERYAPTFDGALAHTSLRVPWYSRDHAPTSDQQYCAAQWTSKATPPVELPDEQVPVDGWCEGVGLLNRAITGAVLAGGNLAAMVLTQRMSSPLTSDLGPLTDSIWGPRADAVLTWRATCNCWRQSTNFRNRSP